jgi:hypothetical protein
MLGKEQNKRIRAPKRPLQGNIIQSYLEALVVLENEKGSLDTYILYI